MPSSYLASLHADLRDAIADRDAYGLTDAIADRLNRLELLIAVEGRRVERWGASWTARRPWLMPFVRCEVSHG